MIKHLAPLLFAPAVLAQPALDRALLPAKGMAYGYHDVSWTPAPKGGVDVKWDFAALPPGAMVAYIVRDPQLAPGSGAFPANATALLVPGEPAVYLQLGDTALNWLGTATETNIVRFDPPIPWVDRPTRARDHWEDSTLAAVTGDGRIELRTTRYKVSADAYGTLVMPYGVVPNVLRLKHELVIRSRTYPLTPEMRETRYTWWVDDCPMPLLIHMERTGWGPPDRMFRWLDGTWRTDPLSLFQPVKLFAFPDPCDELLTVDLPAQQADRTQLQLVNESGNIVKQWSVEFDSPQTRRMVLEVAEMPAGHYTLTWIGRNGTMGNTRLQIQ